MDEENMGIRNKTKDVSNVASSITSSYVPGSSSYSTHSESPVPVNKNAGFMATQQQPSFFKRWRPWLLWWNTEEWMACWIGFVLFGGVTGAVLHGIPSPVFEPWHDNPFMTFANKGNYGLIVLFFVMGGLLWLSMALYQPTHWQVFPVGYVVVFFVAMISNMLASNGNVSNYRSIECRN